MSVSVRSLRGATTVEADTAEEIGARTVELLEAMFERNGITHEDLINLVFTSTHDLTSAFPATGARTIGLGDVPLMCAQEIPVPGSMPRCIRVLATFTTELPRAELRHVYLHRAVGLRDDLPG